MAQAEMWELGRTDRDERRGMTGPVTASAGAIRWCGASAHQHKAGEREMLHQALCGQAGPHLAAGRPRLAPGVVAQRVGQRLGDLVGGRE